MEKVDYLYTETRVLCDTSFMLVSATCCLAPVGYCRGCLMIFSSWGAGADVRAGEKAGAAEPGAALRLGELELREEWQDEEFPR